MIRARLPSLALLALLALLCLLHPTTARAEDVDIEQLSEADVAMEGGDADLAAADLTDEMGLDEDGAPVVDDDDDEEEDEEDEEDYDAEEEAESAQDPPADTPTVIDPPGQERASGYKVPSTAGALFFEDFQSGLSKWKHTEDTYAGRFVTGQGANPTFPGDRALIIPAKANHYGLSASISGLEDMADKDLVLQYEVKLDQGMTCGGAYLKLPTSGFKGPGKLDGSTVYSIMFGPDKCGTTDKVHFIFQSKHPVTGAMTEHHLKDPPSVANTYDKKTHLYTLIVTKDGKVTVMVDAEVKKEGTLSESFTPPVQPLKEIDDAEDKKPADWVDVAKIADPEATKPDDWDEDAPREIPDEKAEKPEGWLEDEPEEIPDPDATKPEEWNDDEDGEWEAPLVRNPECDEVGCGEWTKPMIDNPDYKGKWTAPLIDNPKYIGVWKPRKVPNPDYYEIPNPVLLPVHAVGFEIWTMDQGVLFDNVWVGTDVDAAKTFADETFVKKQITELKKEEKDNAEAKSDKSGKSEIGGRLGPVMDVVEDYVDKLEAILAPAQKWLEANGAGPLLDELINRGVAKPMIVVITLPLVVVILFLSCLGGKKRPTPAAQAAEEEARRKKSDEPTPDDAEPKEDESTAASAEPEKSSARRRRPAGSE